MRAERETAGLAVSFAMGITIASFSIQTLYKNQNLLFALTSLSFLISLFLGLYLVSCTHDRDNSRIFPSLPAWLCHLILGLLFALAGYAAYLMAATPTVCHADGISGLQSFFAVRAESLKRLIDNLPFKYEHSNAIVKAFLTGDRSDLSSAVKLSFRDSGASHILALSGMHLSIIYLILSRCAELFGHSPLAKKITAVLIIIGTGFFTFMTGAVPSLVRAYIFVLIRETSVLCNRKIDNIQLFATSLIIHLALSPNSISDIGFQLSYLAMAGIFVIFPAMENLWKEENGGRTFSCGQILIYPMRKIWSLCCLSIACQLFTAPLAWYYFSSFPEYFLLTNLLCIPLSNAVTALSIFIILLSAIGICPDFLLQINDFLIETMVFCLDTIASM